MTVDISIYRVRVGLFGPYQLKMNGFKPLTNFELVTWLSMLLIKSGDIHVNPGPRNEHNHSFLETANTYSAFISQLSIVHYNIQSINKKSEILYSELNHFDIIALTETWLDQRTSTDDLYFQNYHIRIKDIVITGDFNLYYLK
jgi:hypothetical protein